MQEQSSTKHYRLGGIYFIFEDDAYNLLINKLKSIEKVYQDAYYKNTLMGDVRKLLAFTFQDFVLEKNVLGIHEVQKAINLLEKKHSGGNYNIKYLYRDYEHRTIAGICSGLSIWLGVSKPLLVFIFIFLFFLFGFGLILYCVLWLLIPLAKTIREKQAMKEHQITKKLYRSSIDNKIAGICSGLAVYFAVYKPIFYVFFILTIPVYGLGLVLYLILWARIPLAETTLENISMLGLPRNIYSINSVYRNPKYRVKLQSEFVKWVNILIAKTKKKVQKTFVFSSKFITILFLIIAVLFLVSIFYIYLYKRLSLIPLIDSINVSIVDVLNLFFEKKLHTLIFLNAIFIPLIGILSVYIYNNFRILLKIKKRVMSLHVINSLLVISGLCFSFFILFSTLIKLQSKAQILNSVVLKQYSNVILKVNQSGSMNLKSKIPIFDKNLYINELPIISQNITLKIVPSYTNKIEAYYENTALGNTKKEATFFANYQDILLQQYGNQLLVNTSVSLKNKKWRFQKTVLTIAIPEGKTVYLDKSLQVLKLTLKGFNNIPFGNKITTENSQIVCFDCKQL